MRAPALEQRREERAEMLVDLFEGGQQPRPPFPVQAPDRPSQPVDRLFQFLPLGRAGGLGRLQFGEFAFGDQIDWAKPLAVHRQLFKERGTLACVLHLVRSEEHTSELQSLMRISYAVFCLKKKKR